MIVYVEEVILSNFVITLILLLLTKKIMCQTLTKLRTIIACVFSSVSALIYPLITIQGVVLLVFKLLVGFMIVSIAFKQSKMKKLFAIFLVFLFLTAIYGGINLMVSYSIYGNFSSGESLPSVLMAVVVFVVTYLIKNLTVYLEIKKKKNNFIYEVEFFKKDKVIKTKAYLDSGNLLCEPETNSPIIVINYKLFFNLNDEFSSINLLTENFKDIEKAHYIKISTASGEGKMLVFTIDKLKIKVDKSFLIFNNPTLGLSKNKFSNLDCDALLNPKLMN